MGKKLTAFVTGVNHAKTIQTGVAGRGVPTDAEKLFAVNLSDRDDDHEFFGGSARVG
jgi:hypothetical protein